MGDFNINILSNFDRNTINDIDLLTRNGYYAFINKPTRVNPHTATGVITLTVYLKVAYALI